MSSPHPAFNRLPTGGPAGVVPAAPLSLLKGVQWDLSFVGLLLYTFVIVTFKLGIANIGVLMAIAGLAVRPQRLRFPWPMRWLTVFVLWVGLGVIGSPYREVVEQGAIDRLKLLVVALAAFSALRTRPQIRFFLFWFLAAFTLVPARSSLFGYARGYRLFGRALGPFIYSNPNYLAAIALLAIAVAVALATSERRLKWPWWCAFLSIFPLAVLILLTQSRGGILAMGVFMAPFGYSLMRRKPKAAIWALALGVVVLVSTPKEVWERLAGMKKLTSVETVAEADAEGSARERFALLQTGGELIARYPVFGVGIGAFPYATDALMMAVRGRDPHNMYLSITAETGLPGLFFFVAMLVTTIRYAIRARRASRHILPDESNRLQTLLLGLYGFLVAGIFGSYANLTFFYLYVAVVWCQAEALLRELRQRSLLAPAPTA